MNTFITSQLSYCRLDWMSHSRTIKSRIDKTDEQLEDFSAKDETNPSLDDLLEMDKSVNTQ